MDLLGGVTSEPALLERLLLARVRGGVHLSTCLQLRTVCWTFYRALGALRPDVCATVPPTTGSHRAIAHTLPAASRWAVLRQIHVYQVFLDAVLCTGLCETLEHCTSLTHLRLNGCAPGGAGTAALLQSLSAHVGLQCLDLRDNGLEIVAARSLCEFLPRCSSLQELMLSGNALYGVAMLELAEALRACGNLACLDLGSNGLDFVEAVRLWPLVAHCSALRRMDMSQNMLRHHALQNFAILPGRCTELEHLSLAGNSIGDAGATTLVHALRHCLALQTLDLSRNNIYDTGAHALVRLIDRRVVQRTLDLQCNCISQDGMDALLVAFLSSAGTLELLLRGNPGATDVPRGCPRSPH